MTDVPTERQEILKEILKSKEKKHAIVLVNAALRNKQWKYLGLHRYAQFTTVFSSPRSRLYSQAVEFPLAQLPLP